MQFTKLFKKNFIWWKRGWKLSCCELIFPLILALFIMYLRTLIDIENFEEKDGELITFQINQNNPDWGSEAFKEKYKNLLKDCSKKNRKGGRIALSPENEVTKKLENFLRLIYPETTIKYFKTDSEIEDLFQIQDYNLEFPSGIPKQLCFAISFDEYNIEEIKYNYNLRFNMSGQPGNADHSDPEFGFKIPYEVDSSNTIDLYKKGTIAIQNLIEGFILQNHLENLDLNFGVQNMRSPDHKKAGYKDTLETAGVYLFILLAIVTFLRVVGFIVGERENGSIENMENMGMKKVYYLLSVYCFLFLVHFVYSFVFCIVLKIGIFKNVNYFILLLTYWFFIFNMIAIAILISCFFVKSKKAIVVSLIIFFFILMFWFLRDTFKTNGEGSTTGIAISPIGGLSQTIVNFLIFEGAFTNFGFSDMDVILENFRVRTFFIISFFELIIFIILSFYCFYVVPLGIGIPEHPLFFLGYPKKKKRIKNSSNENNSSGEDIIIKNDEKQLFQNNEAKKNLNFEEVENEFIAQRNDGKNLKITNLTKSFGKKTAVDKLNVEMFTDQIFSLLGHNGAGKTTTLSMISGLINKTSGKIQILGYDSSKNRKELRKIIGICPQKNPIFNYMTVQEHLTLYAGLKGVTKNINSQIDEVLKDIDLYHKKNYIAKNLSGGQKRKLCVALAFIGDSKVILLDEPTSGLDTYARRLLWEMIKKYKKNRLIILTTHNMDEADFLGDRIGIMNEGTMSTCGSSLFLKNRFGSGYELTLVRRKEASQEDLRIEDVILGICKGGKFVSDIGKEIKFNLPLKESVNFQRLFETLEDDKEKLNIDSFGISLSTLEDVFIAVGKMNVDNLEKTTSLKKSLSENKLKSQNSIKTTNIDDKDLQQLRVKGKSQLFFMQLKALIRKRFIYFKRDTMGLVCEIFIPIIVIIAGLGLTKIKFVIDPVTINFTPDNYPYNFITNNFDTTTTPNPTSDILSYFTPTPETSLTNSNTISSFNKYIYSKKSTDQNYAYYLKTLSTQKIDYTIFYNTTAPFAAYSATNNINQAILKKYTNNKNSYLKGKLKPMSNTKSIKNIEGIADGFVAALLLAVAFTFIPASMIVFIIKEREFNAKHQQFISGVNPFAYWISNFIVDYLKYLIPGIFCYVLCFAFQISNWTEGESAGMTLLLILFNGWAVIPFVYLVSFMFKSPSKGQIFVFLISFFFGTVAVIIAFVLRVIESSRDAAVDYVDYFLRLMPFFSFSFGMFNMASKDTYAIIFRWLETPSVFSKQISLMDLIFLIIMGIVFFIGIFIIEYAFKLTKFKTKNPKGILKEINEEKQKTGIEPDVKEEEDNVKNPENDDKYVIKVQDLVKSYTISNKNCCGGKNQGYKIAVKGTTFGIEKGMVFGLLGTNGAGKTSTFKVLTGDVSPTSGSAYIMGNKMPEKFEEIRDLIGYCPQFDSLLTNLTAEEHLELYADIKGISKKYQKTLIDQLIQNLGLEKFRKVQAGTYSGGNKRKLSVAIALIGKPPIIFLDEPSSGMDPQARRFMWSVISDISLKRKNSSIILTTHSMEEAESLSSKLAIMVEGQIKTIGSVQELKNKYGRCFELEIKVSLLTNADLDQMKGRVVSELGIEKDVFDGEEIGNILDMFGKGDMKGEISASGKGNFIYKQLEMKKVVDNNMLFEWIDIAIKLDKINAFLNEKFECEILETFQSYVRFKISEKAKLSQIFGEVEKKTKELNIDNYSVKQISLEQIFVKFAKNIDHDD